MRSVFLFGEINEEASVNTISQLMEFKGKEPVDLFINSNGGNIQDAIAIVQAIRLLPFKVNTICLGHCFSAALIILASGTGKRSAGHMSRMMFHPISAELGYNTHNDAMIIAKEMQNTWNTIAELFEHVSDGRFGPRELKKFDTDMYLTPEDCAELGLIDNILSDL